MAKGKAAAARYWLMKSEPNVYSIDDLRRDGRTFWEGVRNYQARNLMRDEMKVGDLVLFYHSSAEPPGVAGIAKVASEARPDPTQFDRTSEYYDESAKKDDPRWFAVEIAYVNKLDAVLPLDVLKKEKALEGMPLLQKGQRLSVQPVDEKHFQHVLKLAGAKVPS